MRLTALLSSSKAVRCGPRFSTLSIKVAAGGMPLSVSTKSSSSSITAAEARLGVAVWRRTVADADAGIVGAGNGALVALAGAVRVGASDRDRRELLDWAEGDRALADAVVVAGVVAFLVLSM